MTHGSNEATVVQVISSISIQARCMQADCQRFYVRSQGAEQKKFLPSMIDVKELIRVMRGPGHEKTWQERTRDTKDKDRPE
jgi:hypothetical protein